MLVMALDVGTSMADMLGVPVTPSVMAEASGRGAALLALERLGVRVGPPPALGETFRPDRDRHAIYRAAAASASGGFTTPLLGPVLS